jgi:L,D-peptidoglycan transpeptidase YkuD (ErfK/YbiS/YcfS/YnhG family)
MTAVKTSHSGRRAWIRTASVCTLALAISVGAAAQATGTATGTQQARGTQQAGNDSSPIPQTTRQLVVAVAPSWSSTAIELRRYERSPNSDWTQVGSPVRGRIGPKGMRWGRGLHGTTVAGSKVGLKTEGDGTAPAGAFTLNTVFAYDASWATRTAMPFVQVGPNDLFVEDPSSTQYNRHVRLDRPATTAWEKKNRMRLNDPAHRLKVLVEHNTHPSPVPYGGSAIFLHVWRGDGNAVTAGCTAIPGAELDRLVTWLDPDANPVYVLLPRGERTRLAPAWGLPEG